MRSIWGIGWYRDIDALVLLLLYTSKSISLEPSSSCGFACRSRMLKWRMLRSLLRGQWGSNEASTVSTRRRFFDSCC